MSMRGAEESVAEGAPKKATSATPGTQERRSAHPRVHFEALVAVGETKGNGGFEAESIDVSQEGMRLRTAYLPQIGDKLICRFEGDSGEVVAEAEVTWRREQPRGGEFGLHFVKFESPEAEAALKGLCAEIDGTNDAASPGAMAIPGTRVRLHIEGLGSPMKARVRDAAGAEVQVGSNLEFLKVGRTLDLEDMDHGDKRAATVDSVKVEVDPATRVPQLVVALRFEEKAAKKSATATSKETAKEVAKDAGKEIAAAPSTASILGAITRRAAEKPEASKAPVASTSGEAFVLSEKKDKKDSIKTSPMRSTPPVTRPSTEPEIVSAREADDEVPSDPSLDSPAVNREGEEGQKNKIGAALRGAGEKAQGATRAAIGAIGPAFGKMGSTAKGAMSGLLAAIRKKRAGGEEAEGEAQATRRTTAAPPGGALRAAGRKLVRDKEEEPGATDVPKASSKKAALMGSALGLAAVLLVVGVVRVFGSRGAAPAENAQAPEANTSAAVAALPAPTGATNGDPNGTPTANIPLFGPTPLSTTEPVPAMPTQPDGAGAPTDPAAQGAAGDPQAAAAPAGEEDEGGDEEATQGNGKQFGKGNVHTPITLKVKTDGPVETVNGAAGAMGFTISLPGRRALSSATELAKKDKRIASINVVNNPAGAEISVQFKDGVPAYMAKAKGDRLDIALGTDAKKVAKAGNKKKKKADAKNKKKPAAKPPAKKKPH